MPYDTLCILAHAAAAAHAQMHQRLSSFKLINHASCCRCSRRAAAAWGAAALHSAHSVTAITGGNADGAAAVEAAQQSVLAVSDERAHLRSRVTAFGVSLDSPLRDRGDGCRWDAAEQQIVKAACQREGMSTAAAAPWQQQLLAPIQ